MKLVCEAERSVCHERSRACRERLKSGPESDWRLDINFVNWSILLYSRFFSDRTIRGNEQRILLLTKKKVTESDYQDIYLGCGKFSGEERSEKNKNLDLISLFTRGDFKNIINS